MSTTIQTETNEKICIISSCFGVQYGKHLNHFPTFLPFLSCMYLIPSTRCSSQQNLPFEKEDGFVGFRTSQIVDSSNLHQGKKYSTISSWNMVPKLCQIKNMCAQKKVFGGSILVPIVRCVSVSGTYNAEESNAQCLSLRLESERAYRTHKCVKLEGQDFIFLKLV